MEFLPSRILIKLGKSKHHMSSLSHIFPLVYPTLSRAKKNRLSTPDIQWSLSIGFFQRDQCLFLRLNWTVWEELGIYLIFMREIETWFRWTHHYKNMILHLNPNILILFKSINRLRNFCISTWELGSTLYPEIVVAYMSNVSRTAMKLWTRYRCSNLGQMREVESIFARSP